MNEKCKNNEKEKRIEREWERTKLAAVRRHFTHWKQLSLHKDLELSFHTRLYYNAQFHSSRLHFLSVSSLYQVDVDIHTKRLIFEHANAIDLNDILITSNRICIKFYFSPNERVRLNTTSRHHNPCHIQAQHTFRRQWNGAEKRQQMRKVSHLFCLFFNCSTCACAGDFFPCTHHPKSRILCPMICEKVKKQFCKLLVLTILCILLRCRRIVVAVFFSLRFSPVPFFSWFSLCMPVPYFDVFFLCVSFFLFYFVLYTTESKKNPKCMLQRKTLEILATQTYQQQQQSNWMPEN